MHTLKKTYTIYILSTLLLLAGCERELDDDLPLATFPKNGEVFIDAFSSGLEYYPYADSKHTAFSVDDDTYQGSASMRFDIPNYGDPEGAYAGAIFRDDNGGRNLTDFDALTFWAKASQTGTLDNIGFGQDFYGNTYEVSLQNLTLSTNWEKFTIPIPDPSRLTQLQGLFWYAEGPEDGVGYSIWVDEVQFEKLGTIAQPRPVIQNGVDESFQSFIGANITLSNLTQTFNVGSGQDVTINVAPAYFSFTSSNESVATVDELGNVNVIGTGTTVITASLAGVDAQGSLILESLGNFEQAPIPTQDLAHVISIYCDTYTNVPVDFYNGYWQPYQTTESSDIIINGDHLINYSNFNFVGHQFSNPTINATTMDYIHFDVFIPQDINNPILKITLKDFGSNGADGGGDDTLLEHTFPTSSLNVGMWNSLEIPLSGFINRDRFGQIIYENLGSGLNNFYLDNVYLYRIPTSPTIAAPTPTQPAADVISIFSDAYTNISGVDYNPSWGQTTVVTQEVIDGNNTLVYTGLNYQGTDFAGNPQDVTSENFLHIDYYSANSTALNIYLISPGPVEVSYALSVPTTGNWSSVDIPLSNFSPVDLSNVFQLKLDGNGDVYLDNIYFY
jgi:hypothetical protein